MSKRMYGQFCGLARALEIVGERWALLIVRDLLVGPRRFTDLRKGLPRIPTNILSSRLKELEAAEVVYRRVLPPPERSVVYELTEYGRQLEDAVIALGRWGAQSLTTPGPEEAVTADSITMALRTTFDAEAAEDQDLAFELRLGDIVLDVRIHDGKLEVHQGAVGNPDQVIETGPALKALLAGELTPAQAVDSGAVSLTGDLDLLERFAKLFHIGQKPMHTSA